MPWTNYRFKFFVTLKMTVRIMHFICGPEKCRCNVLNDHEMCCCKFVLCLEKGSSKLFCDPKNAIAIFVLVPKRP
jgi:hypothetical protein